MGLDRTVSTYIVLFIFSILTSTNYIRLVEVSILNIY